MWANRARAAAVGTAIVLLAVACETVDGGQDAEIANPASTYCIAEGGTLEIRVDAAGSEQGVCVFADGSECDEWAFYRGECAPDSGS